MVFYQKVETPIEETIRKYEGTHLYATKTHETNKLPVGVKGFCWNRNITEDIVKFHTLLREYGYIPKETSINTLKSGFNCEFIEKPLKLQWIKKVKGKTSKSLLFHFIDQLETFHFIQISIQNSALFGKIKQVFCDSSGNQFKNLPISKSQWLNQRKSERTPQEMELDSILLSIYSSGIY